MIGLPNGLPEEEVFLIILFFILCLVCCCVCVARYLVRRDETNQVRRLVDRRTRRREERQARRNARKRANRNQNNSSSHSSPGSVANFDMQGLDEGSVGYHPESDSEASEQPKRGFFKRLFGRKGKSVPTGTNNVNQTENSFPDAATNMSPAFDRLSPSFGMDDLPEEDFGEMHRPNDQRLSIGNDQRLSYGHDQRLSYGHDQRLSYGHDPRSSFDQNQRLSFGRDQGVGFSLGAAPGARVSGSYQQPGAYEPSTDFPSGDEELARRLQLQEAQLAEEEAAAPPEPRTRLQFVPRD